MKCSWLPIHCLVFAALSWADPLPAKSGDGRVTGHRLNLAGFFPKAAPPHDFHDAFLAALETLYARGGGVLEVDPGEYRLCREVDVNPDRAPQGFRAPFQPTLVIRGAGGENQTVKIHCPEGFQGAGAGPHPAFFRFRGRGEPAQPYAIWIEHLSIEGPDSAGPEGVSGISLLDRRTAVHLNDVHFRNLRKGLWLEEGVGRFTVDYCKFSAIREFALDVAGSGDGSISRCEFAAIGSAKSPSVRSAAIHLKGNTVITENIFGSCAQAAIRIHPDRSGEVTVTGNEFDRNGWILDFGDKRGQSGSQLHVTTNCEFSGNKVLGWHGLKDIYGKTHDPPQVGYIRGRHVAGLHVKDNRFAGLAQDGVGFDLEDADDIQIVGNSFSPNWATTWQPIIGTLFRFRNTSALNVSGNHFEIGWMQPPLFAPLIADFQGVRGAFRSNSFRGHGRGIREDGSTRIAYADNDAGPDRSALFADEEGWISVPDHSEIAVGGNPGDGALRKAGFAKPGREVFQSGKYGKVLEVFVPGPGKSGRIALGGLLKLRVYTRAGDSLPPGIYEGSVAIEDARGSEHGIKAMSIGPVRNLGGMGDWGKGRFSFILPKDGARDVKILFRADSPGGRPYTATLQVDYEEWGGLRLR